MIDQYNLLVFAEVEKCRLYGLRYMKDTPMSSPSVTPASDGSTVASSVSSYSTTKRETVMLPHFSGDEKSAYIKYTVWKRQWESH